MRPYVPPAVLTALRDRPGLRVGLAVIVVTAVLGVLWRRAPVQDLHSFDQQYYLGVAYDLRHADRFTDGYIYAAPGPDGRRPPGMHFAPLYPALLALAARLDPSFDRAMSCMAEQPSDPVTAPIGMTRQIQTQACPRAAPLVRTVQFALLCGFYLLLWRSAGVASGSRRVGWAALGLGLFAAPALIGGVNYLMTETLTLFLTTAATAAVLQATISRRPAAWLAIAGAALGLAALTRPAFEYLFLASAAVGCVLACWPRGPSLVPRRRHVALALSFASAGLAVMAPWILRNALVLSHPALSFGYAPEVLVQRIAFDQMTWAELGRSFVCWLPDGSGMGTLLWGEGGCARFQLDPRPDTFYWIGRTTLLATTIAAAGGPAHHFAYLMHSTLLPQLPWHLLVSVALALRGISINHYWGFVLAFVCAAMTWRALRDGDRRRLIVTLPGWFMLAFHALCAVNQVRYNLMLVVPFSLAGGVVLEHAWAWSVRLTAPDHQLQARCS